MNKEEQRRILIERQHYRYNFKPDKDIIPEHIIEFIDSLLAEVNEYGYAIWRENLYDIPPFVVGQDNREKDFSAYKYLELASGLTTTRLDNLPKPYSRRAIHDDYRSNINIFIKSPYPPPLDLLN